MFNPLKIFGKKKDKSFFLELDESQTGKPKEAKAEATAQPAASATTTEEKKPEPAPAKSTKKTSVKKAKAAKTAEPKSQPTVATATPSRPTISPAKVEPKEVNFATQYLIANPPSRRRPGPSLNPFKEMARQAKVPRS